MIPRIAPIGDLVWKMPVVLSFIDPWRWSSIFLFFVFVLYKQQQAVVFSAGIFSRVSS
jgi:hypothetical protein